jgi:flagellin
MAIEPINSINTNITASQAARMVTEATLGLQKSLLRASSGLRLTSPAIDPAALAQFAKFEAQIERLGAVEVNVSNAASFTQTQDGYLQGVQSALDRMGELSIQAQDPTKSASDLANIQEEFGQLQTFIDDVGSQQFNGVDLFSSTDLAITNDSDGATLSLDAIDLTASASAGGLADVTSGISVSTPTAAATASEKINTAVQNLASMRATVGANLQELAVTKESNSMLSQNLYTAASQIGYADLAAESTQLARLKLLLQAGNANLKQANGLPKSTLQLLA